MEKTFTIIKPNAIKNNVYTKILNIINENGFNILELKMLHLSKEKASLFYEEHKEKPFFEKLIEFMTSERVIIAVLEKENAVRKFRDLIGETNPKDAKKYTIRNLYGDSLEENSIHGSDSKKTAEREINFFF